MPQPSTSPLQESPDLKHSLGASAEISGQRQSLLLSTQKFAGGGGWGSSPDFMPALMTKTYVCSEQLLASQELRVVTWCLVRRHPFVDEGAWLLVLTTWF